MHKMPDTLSKAIAALCEDYSRRERALRSDTLLPFVRDTYRSMNAVIASAVEKTVSGKWSESMLLDITNGTKYERSKCSCIASRTTFFRWKTEIYRFVAESLGLLDPSGNTEERHCAICGAFISEAEFGSISVCRDGKREITLSICHRCADTVDKIEIDGSIGIVRQK